MARTIKTGQSGDKHGGFVQATSVAVPSKSTANSTYYKNADGSFSRVLSTGPVNYQNGSKGWSRIETGVRKATDGRWREQANSLQVQFAGYADDSRLASIGVDANHTVGQRLVGAAHVAGTGTTSTVTYPGALPGTDLKLQATTIGDKETMILRDASAASTWDFALDLQGLSAVTTADGSIALRDAKGNQRLSIPPGYAWDSAPAPPGGATTNAVRYQLDGSTLHVSLDPAWLHDPARVFPVIVDPSTYTSSYSTYVEQNSAQADRSTETVMKVGTADAGAHTDRTFLMFPERGIHDSNVVVSSASLQLFDIYSSTCTASRLDVAPITQPWAPSTTTAYPGPTVGASIGNLTPAVTKSCANTAKSESVGDNLTVSLSAAAFNSWATGAATYYGLGVYTTTATQKWFASTVSANRPILVLNYTGHALPVVLSQSPPNGAVVGTMTPTLSAIGQRDPLLVVDVQFRYQIVNSSGVKVVDSGNVPGVYTVPAGKLQWGQLYSWAVQAYDGTNYSVDTPWYQFNVQVPQPAVTSTLSQNPGHGFDASIGNYTTSATDADISTAGPPLSVARSYNSRDPRTTGAFGAAWASVFDSRATERYDAKGAVTAVVVTYPDGSDVAYGRNADGSFTPPSGRAAKLIHLSAGYELIDKSVNTYTFVQTLAIGVYGLSSIMDVSRRSETFTWTSGHVTVATSAVSGRALHLSWATPTNATAAHIATVTTDPATAGQAASAYTWTYGYAGDQLTSVCPPGTTTACTRYGYSTQASAQTRNVLLDLGATSYWPLAETSGTKAADVVAANEGVDDATYTSVTLGNDKGPLATSAATSGIFNGTSSRVSLPDLGLSKSLSHSISVWFKAAAGTPAGVLWSRSDGPIATTRQGGDTTPVVYLGTDGKLLGEFWISSANAAANPITTSASVADGKWHNVVLTDSETAQTMFLDGKQVGSIAGFAQREETRPDESFYNYLGTGYLGPADTGNGVWPDQPHTTATSVTEYGSYFKGSLSDAAFFEGKILTLADETAIYNAGLHPQTEMNSATRPSGKAYSAVTYDPVSAAVK